MSSAIEKQDPFVTTRWTLVVRAQGESEEAKTALSDLCETYYEPVRRFVRSRVREEEAEDLAQEFFAKVLAGHALIRAAPDRGKFRCYLLGAVKHFLADMRDRDSAAKRGGGVTHDSIHTGTDTQQPAIDPATPPRESPDRIFDRNWTIALLALALRKLGEKMDASDRRRQFETLKPWLTGNAVGITQLDAAKKLGMSEGAVKVAVHRLRQRFRECVVREIAQTMDASQDVEAELKCLLEAVSG